MGAGLMILRGNLFGFVSFLLASFGTAVSMASTFQVIGPCSPQPLYQAEVRSQAPTLGDLTVEVLKNAAIPFQGDRSGIKAIYNSPVGDDALEVLSNTQMRSYGWCVSINGQQPGVMPDEVKLTGSQNHIVWFYAFTLYDRGVWKNFCTPSYKVKSLAVCKQPGL
jgi:hypothetical protein